MNLKKLFKDNPQGRFEVKASADQADIYLYDAIGGWFGIEAKDMVQQINDITAPVINLRINSPGGDVFDGRAIQTALKQHKSKVIAHIDGLAASAATYVALAADEVRMSDGALFMIHKAWTLQIGNADEMRDQADLLDKVDDAIVKDYQRKTGIDQDQITDWMSAETWFTADEAKEHGFIDKIYEGEEVEGFDLSAYQNAPRKQPKKVFDRAGLERRARLAAIGA